MPFSSPSLNADIRWNKARDKVTRVYSEIAETFRAKAAYHADPDIAKLHSAKKKNKPKVKSAKSWFSLGVVSSLVHLKYGDEEGVNKYNIEEATSALGRFLAANRDPSGAPATSLGKGHRGARNVQVGINSFAHDYMNSAEPTVARLNKQAATSEFESELELRRMREEDRQAMGRYSVSGGPSALDNAAQPRQQQQQQQQGRLVLPPIHETSGVAAAGRRDGVRGKSKYVHTYSVVHLPVLVRSSVREEGERRKETYPLTF